MLHKSNHKLPVKLASKVTCDHLGNLKFCWLITSSLTMTLLAPLPRCSVTSLMTTGVLASLRAEERTKAEFRRCIAPGLIVSTPCMLLRKAGKRPARPLVPCCSLRTGRPRPRILSAANSLIIYREGVT